MCKIFVGTQKDPFSQKSGYASSPDGNFDVIIPPRFQQEAGGRYYPRPESTEEAKARMMHMEAQLSQLTGMVEKALKNKKLGKKTVSFDKSISYSDDAQPTGILVTNKKHNHRCNAAANAADISNLGAPSISAHQDVDLHHNLRRLQKSARELKQEVRVLRRLTQLQSMAMKDLVQDTYIKVSLICWQKRLLLENWEGDPFTYFSNGRKEDAFFRKLGIPRFFFHFAGAVFRVF